MITSTCCEAKHFVYGLCRTHYSNQHGLMKHGKSLEWYTATLAAQGGGCAICGKPEKSRRLCIDHDHSCCPGAYSCGRCVRGLLCTPCNSSVEKAERIMVYLEAYRARI